MRKVALMVVVTASLFCASRAVSAEKGESDWLAEIQTANTASDDVAMTAAITVVAKRWPGDLDGAYDNIITQLALRSRSKAVLHLAQFRMLDALWANQWRPADPLNSADVLWADLALDLIEEDRSAEARVVAKEITDPQIVARLLTDKRYDIVTPDNPTLSDFTDVLDKNLGRLQAILSANPDRLAAVEAVAEALLVRGKVSEALSVLDATLARQSSNAFGVSPFLDPDQINWVYNDRVAALERLGRTDEAISVMKIAALQPEDGGANVSQILNLGDLYRNLGRAPDALDAVKLIRSGDVSGYGEMVLDQIRACSYAQLKDTPAAAKAFADIKRHEEDSPAITIETALCLGDFDEAAAVVIRELNDPLLRDDALNLLQDWTEPLVLSDEERGEQRKLFALRARPDVQAAIERVGRIKSFPIWRDAY